MKIYRLYLVRADSVADHEFSAGAKASVMEIIEVERPDNWRGKLLMLLREIDEGLNSSYRHRLRPLWRGY